MTRAKKKKWFDKFTTLSKVAPNKTANSKLEIRNSKQFQMVKIHKVPNKPVWDFIIGI